MGPCSLVPCRFLYPLIWGHVFWSPRRFLPSHMGPCSLVPCRFLPSHMGPCSLVPIQIPIPSHMGPCPLVPHRFLPSHMGPCSLVPCRFLYPLIWGHVFWSPRRFLPSHMGPCSLVPLQIPPLSYGVMSPIPSHMGPCSLVPHKINAYPLIWSHVPWSPVDPWFWSVLACQKWSVYMKALFQTRLFQARSEFQTCSLPNSPLSDIYVTRFGKTNNNAIEHVFMYKLIKINISINMYTEVIFTTPISLQWKGA